MSFSRTRITEENHPLEQDILYVPASALLELSHRLNAPNLIQALCEIMLDHAEAELDALPPSQGVN